MKRNRALKNTKELLRHGSNYGWALAMADGGDLCVTCVRAEWSRIVEQTLWRQSDIGLGSGWAAAGPYTLNVDSCEFCFNCNDVIQSAYCDGGSEHCRIHGI